jgi:hypothetical protein
METPLEPEPGLSTTRSEKHIEKQQREVRIYTSTNIFNGFVHCLPRQRLLDYLNSVLVGKLQTYVDFLPLTEVTICSPNGTEATTEMVLINRDNILFVIEVGQSPTAAAAMPYRSLPFVEKSPVFATLDVPPYKLSGKMYSAREQRLSDLLNIGGRFLPVTDAQILDPAGNSQKASFVAINKMKIIYAEEISI